VVLDLRRDPDVHRLSDLVERGAQAGGQLSTRVGKHDGARSQAPSPASGHDAAPARRFTRPTNPASARRRPIQPPRPARGARADLADQLVIASGRRAAKASSSTARARMSSLTIEAASAAAATAAWPE
jgi:hypothetical protein